MNNSDGSGLNECANDKGQLCRNTNPSGRKSSRPLVSRRGVIITSTTALLTGLAGCNIDLPDDIPGGGSSPNSPNSVPKSDPNEEDKFDEKPQDSEDSVPKSDPNEEDKIDDKPPVPEDFEDGCGKIGPGNAVGGTREGIEFVIRPSGEPAEHSFKSVVASSLRKSVRFHSLPMGTAFSQSISQTQFDSNCRSVTVPVDEDSDRTLVIRPSSSRIYPGALLKIDSVWKGQMRPVTANRAPIRISFSLPASQLEGSASRVVQAPSLPSVRDAFNDVIRSVRADSTSRADMRYEMHSVYAHRQNHVDLGAHFDGLGARFGFKFDSSNQSDTTKVLVKFLQNYFTVDVDLPNAFFADGRDPSKEDAVVSSVTYGRLLFFSAESEYDENQVKRALNAAFNGLGGGSIGSNYEEVLKNTTLRVTVLGGSGSAAAEVITDGLEGINSYINRGAEFSPDTPAFPMSYELTYLSDFSIAQVRMSTEYSQRICDSITLFMRKVKFFGVQTYDGLFNYEIEVYGKITVQVIGIPSEEDTEKVIWDVPVGDRDMVVLSDRAAKDEGRSHQLGEITEITVPLSDGKIPPETRLRVTAELFEYEGEGAGEYRIGKESRDILLSDLLESEDESITDSIDVFREGSKVRVTFTIHRA